MTIGASRCTASRDSSSEKQKEKADLDSVPSTDDIIRDREELAEQIRALKELAANGVELRL